MAALFIRREAFDFGFEGVIGIIKNQYEGQVDTGKNDEGLP